MVLILNCGKHVYRFIQRNRQSDNLVYLPEPPDFKISGLPLGEEGQFGFQL